jgi:ferritin-like metal-binding protein YciE
MKKNLKILKKGINLVDDMNDKCYYGYIKTRREQKMELTEQQLKEAIEVALRVRDNNCHTLAEKDAMALIINTCDEIIRMLKRGK